MEIKVVDARGDACPLPVVKALKALDEMKNGGTLEVHVDNETAVMNVRRMAEGKGLEAHVEPRDEDHYVLTMEVAGPVSVAPAEAENAVCSPSGGDTIAVIDADTMGHGSEELGRTLMKGFLFALSQLPVLPRTILFYNGGAKLTTEGSLSLDDLCAMEAQGVEILTCGTCLNYYGLSDKLRVGKVTNMYTIVETMAAARKIIRP